MAKYTTALCIIFCLHPFAWAQRFELGVGMNLNHIYEPGSQRGNYWEKESHGKIGAAIIFRRQHQNGNFLLRNIDCGFEYTEGNIKIDYVAALGVGGGSRTEYAFKKYSLFLNNYLFNFLSLNKKCQISLGFHTNFAIRTNSQGYYTDYTLEYDSARKMTWPHEHRPSLGGINNPFINQFHVGICFGISSPIIQLGNIQCRIRYQCTQPFIDELKEGGDFTNVIQRLEFNFILPPLKIPSK
jgi:hypothetical protein